MDRRWMRPVDNNGHDETLETNGTTEVDAMKMNHCTCNGDAENGCVGNHKSEKGNQRLSWKIEHIDDLLTLNLSRSLDYGNCYSTVQSWSAL